MRWYAKKVLEICLRFTIWIKDYITNLTRYSDISYTMPDRTDE